MRFTFPHSHAFDGGRLTVEDDGASGALCQIDFGDGTTVVGELVDAVGDDYVLETPGYRTAKGNVVEARTWHIVKRGAKGAWRSIRVG